MAKAKLPKYAKTLRRKPQITQAKIDNIYRSSCSLWHAPPPLPSLRERAGLSATTEETEIPLELTPDRRFDATKYPAYVQSYEIEVSWGNWVYVACPSAKNKCDECERYPYHQGCIILSVDGKCENQVQPSTAKRRASMAVFFGPENPCNVAVEIDEDRHTAQVADLKACIAALVKVISIFEDETRARCEMDQTRPLHTLVIKSHSAYLVQGATEWLPKWKRNGWKNCKGRTVANDSLWRLVDVWVRHLESDVQVLFWLVPRKQNLVAESMALWPLRQSCNLLKH